MRYITSGEIDPDKDYLLIGYTNRFGQLDVAKLKISLLSSYYVPSAKIIELSNALNDLETFLSSALTTLSVDQDKMTVMELSAYCSRGRLDEMIDERTFITCEDFMAYLRDNFETKDDVNLMTKLETMGKPLAIAANKIHDMYVEAFTKKEEEE